MCQEFAHLPLNDFVDGLLDDESRAAVATHLRECPACAARVEALRETRSLLRQAQPVAPSSQFEHRLDARVRQDDLKQEGFKLLTLGLVAVAAIMRLLLVQFGGRGTPAASAPFDNDGRQSNLSRR